MLHPIIYVRGYAMTESERNDTASDPFCGFNVGSTVFRATPDKTAKADKFVFESPVLRMVTDFGYRHVYENGADILDPDWTPPRDAKGNPGKGIPPQSIVVYRYYDDGSGLLGSGRPRDITEYAKGLSDLILHVKSLVCQWKGEDGRVVKPDDFRCYLVAHSMGGLVARAFLQNQDLAEALLGSAFSEDARSEDHSSQDLPLSAARRGVHRTSSAAKLGARSYTTCAERRLHSPYCRWFKAPG